MKIGVISDTHNKIEYTKKIINFFKSKDINYLLHAGDIGVDVLDLIIKENIEFIAVLGNTDKDISLEKYINAPIYKEPHYFKLNGVTFKLMHHPYFLTPDVDVIIYGHLHKFECDKKKSLYLNPGEVCARQKPKIEGALIDLKDLSVEYVYKDLNKETFNINKVC